MERETAMVSYNILDATLTGRINDTSPFLNMTLQCLILLHKLIKEQYLLKCDEWFNRLQLKLSLSAVDTSLTYLFQIPGLSLHLESPGSFPGDNS